MVFGAIRGFAIKGTATLALVAALILGASYANKKFGIGKTVQTELANLGTGIGTGVQSFFEPAARGVGRGIGAGLAGLPVGIGEGAAGVFQSGAASFQDAIGGAGKWFSDGINWIFGNPSDPTNATSAKPAQDQPALADPSVDTPSTREQADTGARSPNVGSYDVIFSGGSRVGGLPLSQAAISYYQKNGAQVKPSQGTMPTYKPTQSKAVTGGARPAATVSNSGSGIANHTNTNKVNTSSSKSVASSGGTTSYKGHTLTRSRGRKR